MIVAADWVTISALATAAGTLVLALATFASVRSANRAARLAERSLLAGIRPVLMPSRPEDPSQKVGFVDSRWFHVAGSGAVAEATDEAVYFVISLRNAGSGIAVLHGWKLYPERRLDRTPAPLDEFERLTRDIYVPGGDVGFWQGAFRDRESPAFAAAHEAVAERQPVTVEILYGDHEGGQRTVSMFLLTPRDNGEGWLASVGRHWSIDRPDPR
jgi:hypothetical protein